MLANKIYLSQKTDNYLRSLKGKTGLTPNLLCRLAFCLSLNDPTPIQALPDGDAAREFNRYTLTGQWDDLFIAYLHERHRDDGLSRAPDLTPLLTAHIDRGVALLYRRVKNLVDIERLLP